MKHFGVPPDLLKEELRRVGDELEKPPSVADARAMAEYAVSTYEREFGSWNESLRAVGYDVNQHKSVPTEDLLRRLQELADELDFPPTVVDNRQHGEYSFNAFRNDFGSWNQALRLAGLEITVEYEICRSDLLEEIHRLKDELGHTRTSAEMKSDGRYSQIPYTNEFGSWSKGLQEAGLTPWVARRSNPHPIYGVSWTEELREQVRDRDGRECSCCGMAEESSFEQFGLRLDVHHICGARTLDNPAVFNAPRNLIAVCHLCHMEIKQYTPELPPHIDQPGVLPD